jgi:2-dehydro-3-deoxyphosphogluconate aldolase/(4S)-4-hydroxy-2-oxoglutarate aldolase
MHAEETTLDTIRTVGVVAVFAHADPKKVCGIADALAHVKIDGDPNALKLAEFTNRELFGPDVFGELVAHIRKNNLPLIPGVGSVVDPYTAAIYLSKGAEYIVGPNGATSFMADIARLCNAHRVPFSPGCLTPSEIQEAETHGVKMPKIFPGETIDPAFLKSVRGPRPRTTFMVTGGVGFGSDEEKAHLQAMIKAGGPSTAFGVGSKLIDKQAVADGNFEVITAKTQELVNLVAAYRKNC